MSPKPAMITLGYAGLIPFVIPALMILFGHEHAELLTELIGAYAFGIICFLAGSWWGMGLRPGLQGTLVLSNFYFLIAFSVYLFAAQVWLLAAAVLLIIIFLSESMSSLFPGFPSGYRMMRGVLTLVASASLLTAFFAG